MASMKYLIQLALIFGLCLVGGDVISLAVPFTLPSSVISMLLILVLLSSGLLKEHSIGESADFMLKNMTFFFHSPPVVGILRYSSLVQSIWWQLLVVNLVSLFACFVASSWTVVLVQLVQKKIKERQHA